MESVRLQDLNITGTGASHGGRYRRVRVTGEASVMGDLVCDRVRIVGQVDVAGELTSEEVRVMGQLAVQGDCNTESFQVKGAFTIGGLLNSGNVVVRLFGPCQAKEIGGSHIRVKRNFRGGAEHKRLTVETIEGDDIQLEYTQAKMVRGKRVIIGPGCEIGVVEYQTDFTQSPRAKVGESKQV